MIGDRGKVEKSGALVLLEGVCMWRNAWRNVRIVKGRNSAPNLSQDNKILNSVTLECVQT